MKKLGLKLALVGSLLAGCNAPEIETAKTEEVAKTRGRLDQVNIILNKLKDCKNLSSSEGYSSNPMVSCLEGKGVAESSVYLSQSAITMKHADEVSFNLGDKQYRLAPFSSDRACRIEEDSQFFEPSVPTTEQCNRIRDEAGKIFEKGREVDAKRSTSKNYQNAEIIPRN